VSAPLSLDHIGVAVRDLAQARAIYRKLGFHLTDLSIHSGQPSVDGKVQPLGSGNHCAMFRQGYMELIGVVDPDKPSSVAPFLKTRQGGFIVALGCESADAAYEVAVQSFPATQKPIALERMVADPDGGSAKAKFRNVLMGTDFPEARVLLIQHLTRDVIWREQEMVHPNGVVALLGAQFLVADPAEAACRYGCLVNARLDTKPGDAALRLDGQTLQFYGEDRKGAPKAYCPSLFGAVFAVADLGNTEALFDKNGVSFSKSASGELLVSPHDACGFALTFTTMDKHIS
jgi:catechol 2,3-dioxygenase-like lactoylglutathione lyase family enzyme